MCVSVFEKMTTALTKYLWLIFSSSIYNLTYMICDWHGQRVASKNNHTRRRFVTVLDLNFIW